MPTTVSAVIYNHYEKKDGTYNVKIRLSHKRKRTFINTQHYVSKRQIDEGLNITDDIVNGALNKTLDTYRQTISKLGNGLFTLSCEELKNLLKDNSSNINFIKFCDEHILKLRNGNRIGTANNHRTVRNSLVDYFKSEIVSIIEINSNMLLKYEGYLRSERTMKRVNNVGESYILRKSGMSDGGLHNHMRDLRTLFNAACALYNNEDIGLYQIEHKPFKKYKVGSAPLTKKRNLSIDQIKCIRDCETKPDSRAELAKELFMLFLFVWDKRS